MCFLFFAQVYSLFGPRAIYNRSMNKDKNEVANEEVWYVYVNNETKGPFSMRDLDVFLRTNELNSLNLAWKVGMKEWKALNEIE